MAFAQKKSSLPAAEERRRFQRVKVHLLGRYMLPTGVNFPARSSICSPGGLALLAPGIGNVGDRVIAYLDHIGRVEGKITRIIDNGFAMTVGPPRASATSLPAQLTWLATAISSICRKTAATTVSCRAPDRAADPRGRQQDDLPDHRPVEFRCCDRRRKPPPLKSLVMLGKVQSRVVRNLEEGFALEFVHEQNHETLEDAVSAR